MIGFIIFQTSLFVFAGFSIINYILSVASVVEAKKSSITNFINIVLPKKNRYILQYSALGIFLVAIIFGNITPYISQENDRALIQEYNSNIKLYTQYSEDYALSARKQIEEYQKSQADMARTATVAQLQFWSQQRDIVGNQLTDSIKKFQDLILEQKLAINKAQARIDRRPNNIWYFGIN